MSPARQLPGPPTSPTQPPRSAGQLEKLVLAYARQHGQAVKRARDWISYMAIGGALERTGGTGLDAHFTLKGGVALELRRQGLARATRDLDLAYRGPAVDPVLAVEEALATPYGRFTFVRVGAPRIMEVVDTVRLEIGVRFDGASWGTVSVDVNHGAGDAAEVELVDALDLRQAFGIEGPDRLPCLSLRYHIAQKLHGLTKPDAPGAPNERVQDAVDVLLFRAEFTDPEARARLRVACIEVFSRRATHAWPPRVALPERWTDRFTTLAEELALDIRTLPPAAGELQAFVDSVDTGFDAAREPSSAGGVPRAAVPRI